MKISHEVSLGLLKDSLKWNDYQYILPHLIDKYVEYKEFMLNYRKQSNSFIICDNGLFENVIHTNDDLFSKIQLTQPDIFIVPDEWNNSSATLRNAKSWIINYKNSLPECTNLMAVCQGTSIGELITTYQTLVDIGYKYIAFNHSSIAYINAYPNYNPLKAQMYGRIKLIEELIRTNTICKGIYHHLLGASDWKEFQAYTEFDWVKSIDTSAPIINGALGVKFNYEEIYVKPSIKIEDIIETDLTNKMDTIQHNIDIFRKSIIKN
jgi:hypothetical protein